MKLTLSDLANLSNQTTAVSIINSNNTLIEAEFENTLSRDGSTPNTMGAALDMNNNVIINVPIPTSAHMVANKAYVDSLSIVGQTATYSLVDLTVLYPSIDRTGASNVRTELQAAINTAASSGNILYIPPGIYRVDTNITIPQGANIMGSGKAATYSNTNSYIFFNHTDYGFTMEGNEQPISIKGLNFYRAQSTTASGWAPTNANYDLQISGITDLTLEDIHFHSSSRAINIVGHTTYGANGRIHIKRITGQVFILGIAATHCTDCLYIDEVHFWPFWSLSDDVYNAPLHAAVLTYTRANATAFFFGRTDNIKVGRIFSYGFSNGLFFYEQGVSGSLPTGGTSLFACSAAGMDNCSRPILVNTGSTNADLHFSQFYGGSNTTEPSISTLPLVQVLGSNARINIDMLYGYNTNAQLIQIATGTNNLVTVGKSYSVNVDADASGTAEFDVATGNTLRLTHVPITSAGTKYLSSGTGVIETPEWRSYTPTITVGSGSLTSHSAVGKFRRVGKKVDVTITVTITTAGTAGTSIAASLPYTVASGVNFIMPGREISSTGKALAGTVLGTGTTVPFVYYDNTLPIANGLTNVLTGTYEAA